MDVEGAVERGGRRGSGTKGVVYGDRRLVSARGPPAPPRGRPRPLLSNCHRSIEALVVRLEFDRLECSKHNSFRRIETLDQRTVLIHSIQVGKFFVLSQQALNRC